MGVLYVTTEKPAIICIICVVPLLAGQFSAYHLPLIPFGCHSLVCVVASELVVERVERECIPYLELGARWLEASGAGAFGREGARQEEQRQLH